MIGDSSINEIEENVLELEKQKEDLEQKYDIKKDLLTTTAKSDFLTGGILASSLFLIMNSLLVFYRVLFPYNLFIGIGLALVSLSIILYPLVVSKRDFRKIEKHQYMILKRYLYKYSDNILVLDTVLDAMKEFSKNPEGFISYYDHFIASQNSRFDEVKKVVNKISLPFNLTNKLVKKVDLGYLKEYKKMFQIFGQDSLSEANLKKLKERTKEN